MTALPGPPAHVWNHLALAAGNLFATRDWAECSWDHFGEGDPVVLTDNETDPRIVIPLYRSGWLLRRWRIVGNGPADQLGPACAPQDVDGALDLIRTFLADQRRWDVAVLHDVAADQGWDRLPAATEVRRVPSPVVNLPTNDWDAFLATRSKSFREQVRRKRKKLDREPDVEFRLASPETLDADLETFFALHQARWGLDAPLAHGVQRRFQADFSRRAAERGWLRLWLLEIGGTPVAASLGYRFGDAEYFYQSGRHPDFEQLSVGAVMMGHTVRHAVETGAAEYRLLRGDEGYKARWADHEHSVQTVALTRSQRGAAAVRFAARRGAHPTLAAPAGV